MATALNDTYNLM